MHNYSVKKPNNPINHYPHKSFHMSVITNPDLREVAHPVVVVHVGAVDSMMLQPVSEATLAAVCQAIQHDAGSLYHRHVPQLSRHLRRFSQTR